METFSNDGLVLENNLMIEHTFSISSTCQILVSLRKRKRFLLFAYMTRFGIAAIIGYYRLNNESIVILYIIHYTFSRHKKYNSS